MEEQNESKTISISDFIISQKVNAFRNTYLNTDEETTADDVFTDSKLRKYFHAYPLSMGDPLTEYVNLLECSGFRMHTSITGEPAIFVKLISRQSDYLLEEAFGKDDKQPNEKAVIAPQEHDDRLLSDENQ